jgi:heme/copper-type cytochrome/quinol oxidase subunit 1
VRITKRPKRPFSLRRTLVIMGGSGLLYWVMHLVVWSISSSLVVRLIFNVIAIVILIPVMVTCFRTLLRANEEAVRQNPKPW